MDIRGASTSAGTGSGRTTAKPVQVPVLQGDVTAMDTARPTSATVVEVDNQTARLEIDGRQVVVQARDLEQGQQVQVRPVQIDPPVLELQRESVSAGSPKPMAPSPPPADGYISQGQLLTARVVAVEDNGRVVLDIQGLKVEAELPREVTAQVGSELTLRVASLGDRPVLEVLHTQVGQDPAIMQQLSAMAAKAPGPMGPAITALLGRLEQLQQLPDSRQWMPIVKQLQSLVEQLKGLVQSLQGTGSSPMASGGQSSATGLILGANPTVGMPQVNPTTGIYGAPSPPAGGPGHSIANPLADLITRVVGHAPGTGTNHPGPLPAAAANIQPANAERQVIGTPVTETAGKTGSDSAPVVNQQKITEQIQQLIGQFREQVGRLLQVSDRGLLAETAKTLDVGAVRLQSQLDAGRQLSQVGRELGQYAQLPATESAGEQLLDLQHLLAQVQEKGPDVNLLRQVNAVLAQVMARPEAGQLQPTIEKLMTALGQLVRQGGTPGQLLEMMRLELGQLLNLDQAGDARQAVGRLHALVQQLFAHAQPPDAEQLQQIVRDGGQQMESKLAMIARQAVEMATQQRQSSEMASSDVKAQLLQTLSQLETGEARSTLQELAQAVSRQLDQVEQQQAQQVLARINGQPLRLEIPMLIGEHLQTVLMSLGADAGESGQQGDGQPGQGQGYRVLFLLEMEGLGRTRVDAHVQDKAVQTIFYIENQQGLSSVKQALPELAERFKSMGYDQVHTEAKALVQMAPVVSREFETLLAGPKIAAHLLDITG